MPKTLEQLVDEVLNKLCEQDFYRFKSGNDLALELAREDMVTFLEAHMRLAYRAGVEGQNKMTPCRHTGHTTQYGVHI